MNRPPAFAPDPPCSNVETEAALLGGLMVANGLIDAVADIVVPGDFADPLLSRIYSAILHEHDLGRTVSPVTLKSYFVDDPAMARVGGPGFLAQLTGSGAVAIGAKDFARQVADLSNRRRFAKSLTATAASAGDYELPLAELAAQAEAAIADALTGPPGAVSVSGGRAVEIALNEMTGAMPGVRCLVIPSLDHVLGAISPGDVVIMASRPGMGKTAVAISYARGVAQQGFGVTMFSLEMRAGQLGARLAADMLFDGAQVPYADMTECTVSARQQRDIARAALTLRDLPLWIEDLPTATVGRLAALVRRHKRRLVARGKVLKLVVVDYLQLLRPDQREAELKPYVAISMVSRALKELAKSESVGILALCQLSRDVEKRADHRPTLSDLRDSGQIEQDADAICFLLRMEEYVKRGEPEPEPGSDKWQAWRVEFEKVRGRIEFIVPKRRFGQSGIGHGIWHGKYQAVRG